MPRLLVPAVVVLFVSAGCLGLLEDEAEPVILDRGALAALIGEPIEQLHDHTDASLHMAWHGLAYVNWSPLIPEDLGREGFAGLRILDCERERSAAGSNEPCPADARDIAFLATDGAYAGFLMVDVSDPHAPRLVSQYKTASGASQEAVPTWDGDWVFLNLQRPVGAADLLANPTHGTGLGIQIVDVRDKANPRFESFVPVEAYGSHVMFYTEHMGTPYVIYNGQSTRHGLPTGDVYTQPVGNSVKIAEFVESGGVRTLVTVGEFRFLETLLATKSQGCFPHDQWAETHPVTGQFLLYVAYWDCGSVVVDISDPTRPVLLSYDDELEPSTRNRIHFFRPDPELRDARVIAYSGPEIDLSPGEPGYVRAYDVTDPKAVHQIGHWRLPGFVENDKPFLFTPHNFDFKGDLMALAHYHGGVWILDVSDPTDLHAVAYYLPHGKHGEPFKGEVWRKTPNFPEAYFPNVYEVKWYDAPDGETYLLVSERGSGLYVLRMDASARSV